MKDYLFGELDAAGRRAVEQALHDDSVLRAEFDRLQLTQTALFSLRDEELPRRIAFVSDKVFEPKWYQAWWNSGPRLGFASAALLAGALVFHATWRPASRPAEAPPSFDQARFERRISEEVARALPAALEQAEQRHRTELASYIKQADSNYQRLREGDVRAMEASYSLLQQKQASRYMTLSEQSGGGVQ